MNDIVERLLDATDRDRIDDAISEITTLRAEVERLREDARLQYQDGHHDGYEEGCSLKREVVERYDRLDAELATLRAEVERLRKDMGEARVVWGEARDCLLKKITEVSIENERLRAALEPFACNCRVLDCEQRIIPSKQCPRKVARAALAQEKQDDR